MGTRQAPCQTPRDKEVLDPDTATHLLRSKSRPTSWHSSFQGLSRKATFKSKTHRVSVLDKRNTFMQDSRLVWSKEKEKKKKEKKGKEKSEATVSMQTYKQQQR